MGFEQPVTLPNLPGMFFRSLFTVARNDQAEAEAQTLRAEFTAPAFSVTQLTRYQQAFDGFVSEVPLTLMYCLAQRVHLAQMLGEEFPWPAPGLVHVSNSLEQHHTIQPSEGFHIKAVIKLPARGPNVSPRRLRPKFTVEFWQQGQHVVTCVSEYQVMPKQSERPRKSRERKIVDAPCDSWQKINVWSLGCKVARDYARLSGDFNPIHLHPLLSRWFGFEQPIIHGMYMSARALAEIERHAQRPVHKLDVTFKRPVPLPAQVTLWHQLHEDGSGSYQICGTTDYLQRLEGTFVLAQDC